MYFSILLVIIGLISLVFVGALRGKEPMVSIRNTLITFVDGFAQGGAVFIAICVVFLTLTQSKKNKELKRRIEKLEREIKNRRGMPDGLRKAKRKLKPSLKESNRLKALLAPPDSGRDL